MRSELALAADLIEAEEARTGLTTPESSRCVQDGGCRPESNLPRWATSSV